MMLMCTQGDPAKVVDGFNNVTAPVNREDFPTNPRTAAQEKQEKLVGGWAGIQRLAEQARNGTKVKTGEWIWTVGEWKGSWKKL